MTQASAAPANVAYAEVLLYRITDVTKMLNISRTAVYDQMRRGRLRSVVVGKVRRIPATALSEYVQLLEREAQGFV